MTRSTGVRTGFCAARLQRLTDVFLADVDTGHIPGAVVLITQADSTAYFESFGFASREPLRAMRRDSIFRIASLTKPITVTAALILQERGKLLLSDPVARFIPELRDATVAVEFTDAATGERRLTMAAARRPMTVQDLMRHTAGFTYGQSGDSLVQKLYAAAALMDPQQTNAEMLAKIAALPLAFEPGTTFEYGMSTDVLGRVIEVVSGMALDRFFAEHITVPLGMKDTGFAIPPSDVQRLALPRSHPPSSAGALAYDPTRPAKWFSGGGGLVSTAGDYSRFCRMLLNGGVLDGGRILARKTVELMTHNHLPRDLLFGSHTPELGLAAPLPQLGQGYGLGLGVRMQAGLSMAPGSVGDYYWGGATGPYFWVDPAEKLTVVLMLQEPEVHRRTRYRPLLRALVYHALS